MPPPDPLRRIFEVVVPRAVETIDMNEIVSEIDLNQTLKRVDLDALLARVDLNEVLQRIDVNALLERIDLDAVLVHVDMDRILGKIDIDRVLERVDIDGIVKRVQVDAIVSATASRFGYRALDMVRRQLVGFDIITTRLVDRILHRKVTDRISDDGSFTGQLAGAASRLVGFFVDLALEFVLYTVIVAVGFFLASLFVGHNVKPTSAGPVSQIVAFVVLATLYQWVFLVILGRTAGMALAGLRVTAPGGSPIGIGATTRRVLVYPFSFVLGLGLIGVVFGRRHRALHDIAAPSRVCYDWGDRPAEMPAPISAFFERRGIEMS